MWSALIDLKHEYDYDPGRVNDYVERTGCYHSSTGIERTIKPRIADVAHEPVCVKM